MWGFYAAVLFQPLLGKLLLPWSDEISIYVEPYDMFSK